MTTEELIKLAKKSRENAYAPYSKYKVGSALLTTDGTVYTGANVESVNYNAFCAERTALYQAVVKGERSFKKIVIVTQDGSGTPCGNCRQALAEFCEPDFEIIVSDVDGNYNSYTLEQLLPHPFSPASLKG